MKKLVLLFAVLILFGSCAIKTQVSEGIGIPSHVNHIEFWNGGGMMFSADNAEVNMRIDTNTKWVGNDISFYIYEVTVEGKTTFIVDSESLSILYR